MTGTSQNSNVVAANCPAGRIATGGGGQAAGTAVIQQSFPITAGAASTNGQTPTGWRVIFSGTPGGEGSHTAYVVCAG